MTREHAIKVLADIIEKHGGYISDRSVEMSLDGYVALGMLKLDEPCAADTVDEA